MAPHTFPRCVRTTGGAPGPALIRWTSRAEIDREFARQQRSYEEYLSPPISLASVVRVLQASLRTRRRAGLSG